MEFWHWITSFCRSPVASKISLIEPEAAINDATDLFAPDETEAVRAQIKARLPAVFSVVPKTEEERDRLKFRLSHLHKEGLDVMEGLDYNVVDNVIIRDSNKKNTNWTKLRRSWGKWCICLIIGLLVGLTAFAIKKAAEQLAHLKFLAAEHFMEIRTPAGVAAAFFSYLGICIAYAIISCVCVLIFGPAAGGSGIPEVVGYLNGVRVVHTINIKTFLGKVLSLIFSYSSGLAIGPEGPMIHLGAIVGGGMGQAKSRTLRLYPSVTLFSQYRNDRDQRDFISSGAAAGVAAAFGAPVGGLLFSIEEASSFWSRQLTWRTFFCCMIAAFTVSLLMRGLDTNAADSGMLKFGLLGSHLYNYLELLPFLLIGLLCGLIGAAFVYLNVLLSKWRRANIVSMTRKLMEVFIAILITASFNFLISYTTPCRSSADVEYPKDIPHAETRQMYCDSTPGESPYYSPLASLFFVPPDVALRTLFSRGRGLFELWSLAVFGVSYFVLAVASAGLTVAAGLFVPMMLVGAAVGRFVGEIAFLALPAITVDPSIYSLIGAAAMLTGFSRLTLSIVVIVVELTENTQYLLPIILVVMVAKWSGDLFSPPLYDALMELKNIPYLPAAPPFVLRSMTILDVMATDVIVLHDVEKVDRIYEVLNSTNHNGFPVVAWEQDENGPARLVYRGFILRKQLLVLLGSADVVPIKLYARRKASFHTADSEKGAEDIEEVGDDMGAEKPKDWRSGRWGDYMPAKEFYAAMTHNDYSLHKIKLSTRQRESFIDLRPYMNLSAITIHTSWNLTEAYRLFRTNGLRHLTVVDELNQVVGMVTRKDLL